jgi:hypothetical protein
MRLAFEIPSPSQRFALGPSLSRSSRERGSSAAYKCGVRRGSESTDTWLKFGMERRRRRGYRTYAHTRRRQVTLIFLGWTVGGFAVIELVYHFAR